MIGIFIFTLFTSTMLFNQYSYEDCKKLKFEPKACVIAKKAEELGKK